MVFPWYIISCFSPAASKSLSLSFIFDVLISPCLGVALLRVILFVASAVECL